MTTASMDATHIEPFVKETLNTFEVLLGITPLERELETKDSPNGTHDVSAIIGISGSGTGGVVVSFPAEVACRIVGKMVGEHMSEVDQDVADGIGELINIISGNAKRGLVKYGYDSIELSLPNVIVGRHRTVWRSKDMPCLVKRFFTTEFGPFCVEVNIRPSSPQHTGR